MILTNNKHRFYNDDSDLLKIENGLIFGKYFFNYAKNNHNILIVSDEQYKKILEKLKEIINEY